jgi:uncharacterized protein (TIGR02285 family)
MTCFIVLLISFFATVSQADKDLPQPIRLYAFHRPPYYTFDGAAPDGFLLDISKNVLDKAKLSYQILEMPPQRIIEHFKSTTERACSPGWFRSPEREEFALFTDPIYVNAPMGVALRVETLPQLPARLTVKELLHSGLTLGVKAGFSYGGALDSLLKGFKDRAYSSTIDNEQFLMMIAKRRIDYAFMEPEEYSWLVKKNPELASSLLFLTPLDAPPGQERRLMCTKALEGEMNKLNEALRSVPASERRKRLIEEQIPRAFPPEGQ